MRLALKMTPSLFPDLTRAFFEECDPELARSSIPANLKILEGLLKSDPGNREILKSLCMGYCGYSMLFVEEESRPRASLLYLRARDYGMRSLGPGWDPVPDMELERIKGLLRDTREKDLEALLWTTLSWNAWINLNLDKPAALAQLSLSRACLDRLMEINGDYQHGLPLILMGVTLSAAPKMLGGDPDRAKVYFERALDLSKRRYFLAQYYFARYYAVMVQDRELFSRLLEEVIKGDPGELRDACLINSVIQARALKLMEDIDNLFL